MICRKAEERLPLYLDGGLGAEEKKALDAHLVSCPSCALLLSALEETGEALVGFPEIDPGPSLLSKLYAIPERKKVFKPIFDFMLRPALQPVFAAFSVLLIAMTFLLFHPEGRGIRKSINRNLHLGYSKVEKLYVEAGGLKSDIASYSNTVINSLKSLNPLKGKEE